MKKFFYVAVLLFLSVNCAYAWEFFMQKCIASWICYPVDSVINRWGYPDREQNIAGKKLLIWINYEENLIWLLNEYVEDYFNMKIALEKCA